MNALADDFAESIRVLLRAFTIDENRFPPAEGRMKYNAIDFQTIAFIARHKGCKALDVAQFLGIAPTTAQSAIDRLVAGGLVARERGETDRRVVELTLTADGRAVHAAIRRQDRANCALMLGALPESERMNFVTQLKQIAARVDKSGET
jgi:DNA-binding MarR family transcriptional regulator